MISRRSAVLAFLAAVTAPAVAQTSGSISFSVARNLPDCDRPTECRFMAGTSSTTLLACIPTFDRQGNVSSGDCHNITTTEYRCLTCGKSWLEKF